MNQPVSYLQTDARWANNDYSAPGEKTTIGKSGCGPTAMAMVLATWADPAVTPATECAWALKNGYKAKGQGTYYAYFVPAGKRYGLTVKQLNGATLYGNASSSYHATAKKAIDDGDLVIACMGPGNWTSSGHFVLVWNIVGNTIYINDPASTKAARTAGDYSLFKKQVKYYFTIKRPAKVPGEEDEEVDIKKLIDEITPEQAYALMSKAQTYIGGFAEPDWSKQEGHWKEACDEGVMDGTRPQSGITRAETAAVLGRLGLLKK